MFLSSLSYGFAYSGPACIREIGAGSTLASAASTDAPNEYNCENTQNESDRMSLPTLHCNGEQWSKGSVQHPDRCTPCAFYCFKLSGCSKEKDCSFCHMNHVSKQRQLREEWKLCQRQKRRSTQFRMQGTGLSVGVATKRQIGSSSKTLPHQASASQSCPAVYRVSEPNSVLVYAEEPCFIAMGSNCRLYHKLKTGPAISENLETVPGPSVNNEMLRLREALSHDANRDS